MLSGNMFLSSHKSLDIRISHVKSMACESVGMRVIQDVFNEAECCILYSLAKSLGFVVPEYDAFHILRLHAVVKDRILVWEIHFEKGCTVTHSNTSHSFHLGLDTRFLQGLFKSVLHSTASTGHTAGPQSDLYLPCLFG